jgi:hypothetical protein
MIEDTLDQATLFLLAPTAIVLAVGALAGKREQAGFIILMEIFVIGWFASDIFWIFASWQLHDAVSFLYLVILIAFLFLFLRRWRWAVRKSAEVEKFVEPSEAT